MLGGCDRYTSDTSTIRYAILIYAQLYLYLCMCLYDTHTHTPNTCTPTQVDATHGSLLADSVREAIHSDPTLTSDERLRVLAVEVAVWGRFVPALNALLTSAVGLGCDLVWYASTEMALTEGMWETLEGEMDEGVLGVL